MTTVHTSPDYQMVVTRPAPPDYPTEVVPDTYTAVPDDGDFESRRRQLLAHWARNPAPNNTKMAYYELARLAAGGVPHEGVWHAALDFIDARQDCSDFVLHAMLRLLFQFGDKQTAEVAAKPPGVTINPNYPSAEIRRRTRQTILNFKYWPDEPGVDSLCTWTENHQILFAGAAYLAGQLYPDGVFTNSGHTGREKMALNRPRIRRWLDLRWRTGFSEWWSHVYYDEDITALLSLVDFCADVEIRQRAIMVIDLLLLDMALNSYRGVFGSSHGRAYENTKKWAAHEGTADVQKLLFGLGQFAGFDNMSAINLALSGYRLPPVIAAIARDVERPQMENRQRMGIRLAEAEKWGLQPEGGEAGNFEDSMALLTLEAYVHPRTIARTLAMFDAFNWWDNRFFAAFRPYRRLLKLLRRFGLLRPVARAFAWDLCRNTREEVNLITYRTPDYMLSCAQDYRPGYGGDQQHIWQATLGADAVCFTTHPAKTDGESPAYWAGSGQLPRAAQVQNVAIIIYHLHGKPALYVPTRLFFTHAWLPQDQFDEVVEEQGWIFARKGDGYLALRSQRPYQWNHGQTAIGRRHPEDVGREVIAPGKSNIWICECGRRADDGPFVDFVRRIVAAPLAFDGVQVTYHSPSQGELAFGWKRPLLQNGQVVPLENYPRYQNPFVKAPFPPDQLIFCHQGQGLHLDWQSGVRESSQM